MVIQTDTTKLGMKDLLKDQQWFPTISTDRML